MTERTLRTRLKDSAGGRTYAEAVAWGYEWESIRHQWFEASGLRDRAADAAARMQLFEREYVSETGENLND